MTTVRYLGGKYGEARTVGVQLTASQQAFVSQLPSHWDASVRLWGHCLLASVTTHGEVLIEDTSSILVAGSGNKRI